MRGGGGLKAVWIFFPKIHPIWNRYSSFRWMNGDDLDTRTIYHTTVWTNKKTLKLLLRRTLVWWTSMFSITQNIAHLIKCASQINIHAYLHLIQPITYNKSRNENCPIKIIKSNLVRCLSFFSVSWFNNLIVCMSYMINIFSIHMNWIKIAYHFICAI